MPILLTSDRLDSQGQDLLNNVFGRKDAGDLEIKRIVEKIADLNIDKEIRDIAESYAQEAFEHLHTYEDSSARKSLENSARFIVERSL